MAELNERQEAFCREYVANGFNATAACIKAGYSEDSAAVQGSQNLRNPKIKERIEELMKDSVKRAKASADDVFQFASNAAFFDLGEFFEVEGAIVTLKGDNKLSDVPKEIRQLIQSIKPKKTAYGETVEIVFVDKMKALDMLARFHSMYNDKLEVTSKLTEEERRARIAELEAKVKASRGENESA